MTTTREVPAQSTAAAAEGSTAPPDELDALGSRIVGLAARIAGATCRWLLLVAEFDQREGHARWGLASTSRWLTHACGISNRTAADHVRVARALAAFPALAAALEAGRISYSHARAVARLAHPGEERLVSDLIGVAQHGTVGQLETVVRGLRTVEDNAADSPHSGEYLRHHWSSRTSHWQMSTRLDPERGALVEHAVAQIGRAEGLSATDAPVRMAEIALAALHHREDGPPRGLRGTDNVAVRLEITAGDVSSGGSPDVGGDDRRPLAASSAERVGRTRRRPVARIVDGPGLPRRVVERLLCACRVQLTVLDGDRNVLDLGRRKRVVDDRLFRALLIRDRHCAHPGCTSRYRLEAHHVIHWLHGGRTDMLNLVLLCSRHHHAHHDGEFTVHRLGSRRRGTFVFRRADGTVLDRHIDPSTHVGAGATPIEQDYAHLPDATMLSKTTGDRLDRAWAVAVLADRRHDRLHATTEPPVAA